jgi:hypothetical protein
MSAHNSFLRLNSTAGSQPGSPTASTAAREIKALQAELLAKESEPNSPEKKPQSWFASAWQFLLSNPKLRSGLTHVGLVIILAGYTAAGASVTDPL